MAKNPRSPSASKLIGLLTCGLIYTAPALASYEEGVAAYNAHRYEEAVKLLTEAKTRDFSNANLHYYLANALVALRQRAQAIQEYKVALDLQPDGKLATYCETAIKNLESAASQTPPQGALVPAGGSQVRGSFVGTISSASKPLDPSLDPNLRPNSQPARCVSFLCGCSLCARFEVLLNELQVKYGEKIKFIRKTRDSDQATATNNQNGQNGQTKHCPTIDLFGEEGGKQNTFDEKSSDEMVRKEVSLVAARARLSTMATTTNSHLTASRDEIVHEVMARIASDRRRVDEEIKAIRHSAIDNSSDRVVRSRAAGGADLDTMNFTLDDDSKRRIKMLEDDFKRRKHEWISEAERKLQLLGLTGSDASLAQFFSDSD